MTTLTYVILSSGLLVVSYKEALMEKVAFDHFEILEAGFICDVSSH